MIRKNSTLKPSKLRRRRRKIFAIKALLFFFILIGFVFLLSRLSKIKSIQIESIEILGNSTLSKEEIIDLVKAEMSTKYFKLFSKNSIFLYPKKSIQKTLADDFKKINTISIKSKGLKTVIVNITERKPSSLWCLGKSEEENDLRNNNLEKCYFLDKEGLIFSEAPDFSGNSFLRYYGLLDDTEQPIGKNYMTKEKFNEVSKFVSSLEILGIKVGIFWSKTESDYEIVLKNGIKLILDDKKPFDKILENIQLILSEVDLKDNRSSNNQQNIDYIDLRFGNKVYFKFE